MRTLLRRLHLWLGLSVGAMFALLGLTGSALVFYQEADALLHPAIRVEAGGAVPGWTSPVWDRALATVHRQWPDWHGQWRFEVTGQPGPIPARYYPSGPPSSHMARRIMVWLSPDGTRVLRAEPWGGYAMSWIYELHMQLLSGEAGHQVVGWSGVAILVLLLSGLAVWWPRGSLRKALAFKRRAAPIRRLRDLHKLSALASLPLLILFAATGFLLALPAQSDWLLGRPASKAAPRSVPRDTPPITLTTALAAGHRALPSARLVWIEMPAKPDRPIALRVQVPGDPSARFPHSYIYIDRFDGRVLSILDARTATASTTITNWLHPLHDASVGGLPTRILAFIIGLIPAGLFLTGLLHWRARSTLRRAASVKQGHS